MQSVIPPGDPDNIVIAGKAQGFLGLAICYGTTTDPNFPGTTFPTMTTAYQPTPDEVERIVAGAPIVLQELGRPPITPRAIWVGEVPQ